jgi:hypothetical protein
MDDLSTWLLDILVGNRGWVHAVDAFTTLHFGGHKDGSYSWSTVFISYAPSLFVVSLTCAALGAFRLQAASVWSWILIVSFPLSRAICNYFLVGTELLELDTYLIPFLATGISAISWHLVRRLTKRWRAITSGHDGHRKEQVYLCILIVLIAAVSALGWHDIRFS